MEPFERDELQEHELEGMLRQWRAPQMPARLRLAVFPKPSRPWWLRLWATSVRVPLPLACALVLVLALALGASLRPRPAATPRTVIKTERVEVPLIQERVVTRIEFRDRKAAPPQDVAARGRTAPSNHQQRKR
jgi:hypothetical protein